MGDGASKDLVPGAPLGRMRIRINRGKPYFTEEDMAVTLGPGEGAIHIQIGALPGVNSPTTRSREYNRAIIALYETLAKGLADAMERHRRGTLDTLIVAIFDFSLFQYLSMDEVADLYQHMHAQCVRMPSQWTSIDAKFVLPATGKKVERSLPAEVGRRNWAIHAVAVTLTLDAAAKLTRRGPCRGKPGCKRMVWPGICYRKRVHALVDRMCPTCEAAHLKAGRTRRRKAHRDRQKSIGKDKSPSS